MPRSRIRLTAVLVVLSATVLLALASGASGAVVSSQITSPSDGSYFLEDTTTTPTTVTIKGTFKTNAPIEEEEPEIRCYYGSEFNEVAEVEEADIKEKSPKGSNEYEFTVKEVSVEEIGESPCVLRVVPFGYKEVLAPGTVTPFEGPRVAYSEFALQKDAATTIGYDIEARTFSSIFEIDAAGQCGLGPSSLISSPSMNEGAELFRCAGALFGNAQGAGRPAVKVDGHNAYDPYGADAVFASLHPAGTLPAVTVTKVFEKTNGLKSIHETDPLVICEGTKTAFPETAQSCEKFAPAGISLERVWTASNEGRLISMSDAWHSTDAAAHAVDVLYTQELGSDVTSAGSFRLPGGAASFAPTKTGDSAVLSAADGAILYRQNGTAAEAIGGNHPVGAIVFDTSPSAPITVPAGTADTKGFGVFDMPYQLDVPAGGTRKLSMTFAQGYTVGEVCALAESVKSGCQPSLAITSPGAGTTTSSPAVNVSGTASDFVGLSSVTVNGHPVSVAGGKWSTTVGLAAGANTISVEARNQAGLTRSATTSVSYLPVQQAPAPQPPRASRAGAAKLGKGAVSIVLACSGSPGTNCTIKATLVTIEKLHGGRPTALSAAHLKKVTVGSTSVTIPAGSRKTVTIKLNATGRSLLAKFHKLPTRLAVVQQGVPKASSSVAAQKLTLIAKRH